MIYIFRGDDTTFAGSKFLTFRIDTDFDLTGWKAIFNLGSITKTIDDISNYVFDVELTHEETNQLWYGELFGSIKIVDGQEHIKTIANKIPFCITNELKEVEHQIIDLPTPESSSIDINLQVGEKITYGSNLFDTKIVDYKLEGEEADGWAVQGTYVYKKPVAGQISGYPDFYERCLTEYKDPNNTQAYFSSNVSVQGVPTDNKGVVSNFSSSNWVWSNNTFNAANADNWKIQVKILTHTVIKNQGILCSYLAHPALLLYLDATGHVVFEPYNEDYEIVLSLVDNDFIVGKKADYIIELEYGSSVGYTLTIKDLDGNILSQKTDSTKTKIDANAQIAFGAELDDAGKYYQNLYRGSIDLNDCYFDINGVRTWNGVNTITKNKNTHMFYPISEKENMDKTYEVTGYVNAYGVDEENERIFLPRNKWLSIAGTASVAGNGLTMGFKAGTQTFGFDPCISNEVKYPMAYSTLYGTQAGTATSGRTINALGYSMSLTDDPDKSGVSAQLRTNEGLYLYYCVGNTKIKKANQDDGELAEIVATKADKTEVEALAVQLDTKVDKTQYETFTNEVALELADKISREEYEADKENNTGGGSGSSESYLVMSVQSGNSWFRKYSDGWLEQGGMYTASSATAIVSFLMPFKDANLTVSVTPITMGELHNPNVLLAGMNKSSFMITDTVANGMIYWEARGMSA